MIVVCDINEVWRRKPFAALAGITDTLGVAPADWMVARNHPEFNGSPQQDGLTVLPVALPPGWASRTAAMGQRLLWLGILQKSRQMGKKITGLVVTSPHYLPLLGLVRKDITCAYYASDDYRSYDGWKEMAEMEKELVRRVDHSFFVSAGLMERAQREYGVDASRLSVSMNATEPRFFPADTHAPVTPPCGGLSRPIVGVVGGINDRLDFNLLRKCADLPELGSLLLVGPVPKERSPGLTALLEHHKCVAVGAQPHDGIHLWFQSLDVGLIPYTRTEFNRLCSPMRLFDHLASTAPLIATDACEQVAAFKERVSVCKTDDVFVETLVSNLECLRVQRPAQGITWSDRAKTILGVMEDVAVV